ncbi:MAG: hypothetical protein JSU74_13750 [Candidatus Zixiibacteriota bacterium]|nr:MAG: hypothetical protein JSU74_13750 [candidate division Zixibacteria bacterium]
MDRKRPRNRRGRNEEPANFLDSFIFKFSTRVFLGIVIILAFLTLVQCTVKKPESPQWNTTFVVPVINRTFDMEELVDRIDQDEIIIDSTGDVAFSISHDLDTVELTDDDFSVADLSYTMSETLGTITMQRPPGQVSVISLDSLTEGFPTVPGFDTVIIPANTQIMADADRQLQSFTWAEVASGGVRLTVTNRLGFTLYNIVARVIDNSDGHTIEYDSLQFPLVDGETDSVFLSLAGEYVTNDLRFSLVFHSDPGSDEYIDPNGKEIITDVSFPQDIEVIRALAEIPALDDLPFSQNVGLELQESETIDAATLASGSLSLSIDNNTNLPGIFTVTVSDLRLDDVPLTVVTQIAGNQSAVVNTDISGYVLTPSQDSVEIETILGLPGSGGTQVLVQQTDNVSVDAGLTNLNFHSVTGMFANTSAELENIHEELDVPDGFDNISLVTAILTIDIENAVDMPGHMDITISGDNGKTISLTGDIEPRGSEPYQISTITNDDIADFLSPLPEAIDVSGTVEFGDALYHGTISVDDYIFTRVRIYAPLNVRVNNAEITDLDIEVEEIDQDDIDMVTDHVVSARFVYSVTNHLPLGVAAVVHLSHDSASLYTSPELTIDTLCAEPAPVSLATGTASEAVTSNGEISLDNDDIQILNNDLLYIRQQLFLNASDTSGVKLTENDYIIISGRIEVEYYFDGDF